MKQLKFSLGGRPVNNDDFVVLQRELTDAVQAQFLGKGPFILSGCQVSGPASGATITAGIVCLNGQLLRFAGQSSVVLPAQFQAGAEFFDPDQYRPYQTGGSLPCMREIPAVLVASDPGYTGGEFLTLDTWGGLRWSDVVRASVRYLGETQPLGTLGFVANDYDATGLGLPGSPAWGWALANGENDTDDMRGLSIVGQNSSRGYVAALGTILTTNSIGDIGGKEKATLSQANLPSRVGQPDVATYVGNGVGGNLNPGGSNGWQGQPLAGGNSEAFDIRSPWIALPFRQWVGY